MSAIVAKIYLPKPSIDQQRKLYKQEKKNSGRTPEDSRSLKHCVLRSMQNINLKVIIHIDFLLKIAGNGTNLLYNQV